MAADALKNAVVRLLQERPFYGHFILNRTLGERNQWPAMDVLASLSRVMSGIATPALRF